MSFWQVKIYSNRDISEEARDGARKLYETSEAAAELRRAAHGQAESHHSRELYFHLLAKGSKKPFS